MLEINGRKFMNIQEAVQWLLENNALPFMCKADYAADTIIAKSEIVNPSPAEIKVGAVVYFHDSIIAVVTGITSNGFKVGSNHIDMREGLLDGNIHIGGNLDVDGKISVDGDAELFENIVDKDGHHRFVEGDVEIAEITGITKTYGKWSLSGSHLMVVLALEIASGTSLSWIGLSPNIDIPSWIKDKLVPISSQSYTVEIKSFTAYDEDLSNPESVDGHFFNNTIYNNAGIYLNGNTPSTNKIVRLQFDFLIDNE